MTNYIKTIVTLFMIAGSAVTTQAEPYLITDLNCKLFERKEGRWIEQATSELSVGTPVLGQPSANQPHFILFQLEGRVFALAKECLSAPQIKQKKSTKASTPFLKRIFENDQLFANLSFFSWQESLDLHSTATNQTYEIRTNFLAIGPSVLWTIRWFPWLGIGGELSPFIGRSDATETQSGVTYRAKGRNVYGLKAGFSAHWYPASEWLSVGLSLPLIMRFTDWPTPAGAYSLSKGTPFWPALILESRFQRGKFLASPKVGVYRTLDSLLWGIDLGYAF